MEYENSEKDSAYGPYPCPHGIGCAEGDVMRCMGEQCHAQYCEHEKSANPESMFQTLLCASDAETECETAFA